MLSADLVSVNNLSTDSGNNASALPVISGNGRYVVFQSDADDLVDTDTNGTTDIFRRDLQTGVTELVSVNSAGTDSGNDSSFSTSVSVSSDGRYIAFESAATDLVSGVTDTNGLTDVFVRDLQSGTTTLISTVDGDPTTTGDSDSFSPIITPDGAFVAFLSDSSDLTAITDSNGGTDVFLRNMSLGTTALCSINLAGDAPGDDFSLSSNLAVSSNGQFVAFDSYADDLVDTDTNGTQDVFVRDVTGGTTDLISINASGTDSGNVGSGSFFFFGDSFGPAMSSDGRYVVFTSIADDLVGTDTNDSSDVFRRDRQSGTTELVSINDGGTDSASGFSQEAEISANGNIVGFQSDANDLVASGTDTNDVDDVYVRDMSGGTTSLVSVDTDGFAAGSADGLGLSHEIVLSADGSTAAFLSNADNLVSGITDNNSTTDVFIRDLAGGSTTLASVATSGTDTGDGMSLAPVISSDGAVVAFQSDSTNLVGTDTNGGTPAADVFETGFVASPPGNSPPTADAGGPYTINEGDGLNLDASASSDEDSDPLTYSWDVNGDNTFGDATGVSPSLTWAQLVALGIDDGPTNLNVTVRVDDGVNSPVDSTAASLTVNNVAPTADVSGATSGNAGDSLAFTFTATDPSAVDDAAGYTFNIDWDGDGNVDETASGASGTIVNHSFTSGGTFNVKVSATDKDNDTGNVATSADVVISSPAVIDGSGNLTVTGTGSADTIQIVPGSIKVLFNGVEVGDFPTVSGRIVINGNGGADTISVDPGVSHPVIIHGGAGNDTVTGGAGNDALFGDGDNDSVTGGGGRDMIIGGAGADHLGGLNSEDILIAGTTSHDSNLTAITAILDEWGSARTFKKRVANLSGTGSGPRLNGNFFLKASGTGVTVFDDGVADLLTGGADKDWLFARTKSGVRDTIIGKGDKNTQITIADV